jgi:hypothetical protein
MMSRTTALEVWAVSQATPTPAMPIWGSSSIEITATTVKMAALIMATGRVSRRIRYVLIAVAVKTKGRAERASRRSKVAPSAA